jgi:hypothetical protein
MGNPYTEDTSPVRLQSGENQQPQTTLPVGTPPIGTDNAVTTTCGRSSCKGCPLWKAGKCPRVGSPPVLKADEGCHLPSSSIAGAPPELHRDESNQSSSHLSSANATDKDDGLHAPNPDDQEIVSAPCRSLPVEEHPLCASPNDINFCGVPKDSPNGRRLIRLWYKVRAGRERQKSMTPEEVEREHAEYKEIMARPPLERIMNMKLRNYLATKVIKVGGKSDE